MKKPRFLSVTLLSLTLIAIFPLFNAEACVQPPSGAVSWWSGDGHPFDLIGTNNGTMTNGATYSDGMVGKAFSFDGADDYVNLPTPCQISSLMQRDLSRHGFTPPP